MLREFIAKIDDLPTHFVETETHIGTHVELSRHLKKDGKSSAEMPLDILLGEAIVLNFDFLTPKDGEGQAITPSHLSKLKEEDIILMWSSYEGKEHPYISAEAIKWLAQRPIKMIGTEPSVEGEDPRSEEPGFSEAWATPLCLQS
jgi:kynurenine formamidase